MSNSQTTSYLFRIETHHLINALTSVKFTDALQQIDINAQDPQGRTPLVFILGTIVDLLFDIPNDVGKDALPFQNVAIPFSSFQFFFTFCPSHTMVFLAQIYAVLADQQSCMLLLLSAGCNVCIVSIALSFMKMLVLFSRKAKEYKAKLSLSLSLSLSPNTLPPAPPFQCSFPFFIQIDGKDADGRTALHWAAFHSKHKLMKILLENGASPLVKDNEGR